MAKTTKTVRDLSRRASPRAKMYEERKAEWEAKVRGPLSLSSCWDVYGFEIDPKDKKTYVDGRRLVNDLRRLHRLTNDPLLLHAADVISAYGFDKGKPRQAALRVKQATDLVKFAAIRRELPPGISNRDAAEKIAAEYGIEGASFDTVVTTLRMAFARDRKNQSSNTEEAGAGSTERYWLIAENGQQPKKIPDNLEARSKAYSKKYWSKLA